MRDVDPREYRLDFFAAEGFTRKRCKVCGQHFWTLDAEAEVCQDAPCVEYSFDRVALKVGGLDVRGARSAFVTFMEKHGHTPVKPRPVVARWRDDLYLTIASIVVFQPHVTSGIADPPANPLVISQPCIRLEDIDNVGLTIGRHLTSFEMAAHHAFNSPRRYVYWKDRTVELAYLFFTKELGVPGEALAFKESWWEGGGNAGPCFEVAVGGLELATLVFMQYRVTDGAYEPMELKIVDTGYGVERIAWFASKTPTAFQAIFGDLVDRFRRELGVEPPDRDLIEAAFRAAGRLDPEDPSSVEAFYASVARRAGMSADEVRSALAAEAGVYALLDHTKTLSLMLGDLVVPSNTGEGYLARLVLRRAMRVLARLGADVSLADLVAMQVKFWGADFPQLRANEGYIIEAVELEEERYRKLLSRGAAYVEEMIKRGKREFGLDDLVLLYDSHGIPPEIVKDVAGRHGIAVSVPHNFYSVVASRHSARAARAEARGPPEDLEEFARKMPPTRALFHEDPYMRRFEARVVGVRGRYVVLDRTCFYPLGGGQDHDTGWLELGREKKLRVRRVIKLGDVVLHEVEGASEEELLKAVGSKAVGVIDWERRYRIMRHHTATHVLLGALRRVLGAHVWQAGAEKSESKGRLDVTHHKPVTPEEVAKVEELVNRIIDERRKVSAKVLDRNEAEEAYGLSIYQGGAPLARDVRLVEVEGWDVQACFGTHLSNTGELGGFKIINVTRIQEGVVRFEYVAGTRLYEEARSLEGVISGVASMLSTDRAGVEGRLRKLLARVDELEESLRRYRGAYVAQLLSSRLAEVPEAGVALLVFEFPESNVRALREVLKDLTARRGDVVAVALVDVGRGSSLVEISVGREALARGVTAVSLASRIGEELGGRGGGKRDHASVRTRRVSEGELSEIVARHLRSLQGAGG